MFTMKYRINIICFILLFTVNSCTSQTGLQRCDCVPRNRCFSNLLVNSRELDIRIINSDKDVLVVTPTQIPNPCTAGLIQCCTECGLVYNISYTAATTPAAGQAPYGSQPWQATLLDNNNNYLGGGVLLDARNVLTAAHKVYAFQSKPANLRVSLGEWNFGRGNTLPYAPRNSTVSKMFIHEEYVDTPALKNLFNDIAVLRLATPILYGPTVNPAINTACLPNAAMNFEKVRCTVSGWGKDAFNGNYQKIIKEVNVNVINNSICQDELRNTRLGKSFLLNSKSFICAGGESGKDACTGDGGSPLMCNVAGSNQVVGLVAWGIGCGQPNVPGVYVRVQSYLAWINNRTRTL